MWKPGSDQPDGAVRTPAQKQPPSRSPQSAPPVAVNRSRTEVDKSGSAPSSLPRKRLSGATMNMKFMKRKKDFQHGQEKQNDASEMTTKGSSSLTAVSMSAAGTHSQRLEEATTRMDIEKPLDTAAEEESLLGMGNNSQYSYGRVATSVDMYGSPATLIGRRSFGGFNAAVERAFNDSKASSENQTSTRPQQKISDEELLKRYKETVMQRDDGDRRGVGNLDGKMKKRKRQQGLR